jgi:uroporphyrinogen decarboxylase|tara:strand:+ start:606 stop:1634 length:1029 start_codon:yes stop_codon:yes gene_type:complete
MMNAKENALRTIRFDSPERIVAGPPSHAVGYLGCNHEGYEAPGHDVPVGTIWTDVWGTTWQKKQSGVMGFPRKHPMADLVRGLKEHSWPNPDDERICGRIHAGAEECDRSNTFLLGSHRETLWEKSYMLVGMEDLMCYIYTEPGAVKELLHRVVDFDLAIARHYVSAEAEMVFMGDDLGTQSSLLFSPEILDTFFVPEYQRLFDFYKAHNILINFHSCGHVSPILEVFMELGVDILNPVQESANDLQLIRDRTEGRMALQGGINSGLIVSGPVEAIRREVHRRIHQLGKNGGYFCGPDQAMPWPKEHIRAWREAVEEFGKYPLTADELDGDSRETDVPDVTT